MTAVLLLLLVVVIAAIALAVISSSRASGNRSAASLADAKADARRVIERLGGQVLNLTGKDEASKQALADASERFTAASSQIDQATTARQAQLAKESAVEGLYYVRAARSAMGMDPGPELETLGGQQSAGAVTEDRRVQLDGREIEASPNPSARTPNYYPGGRVAGRPVPAGWYSEPWWKPALIAGAWGLGSVLLFDTLFSGMHGVGYSGAGFENGYGQGFDGGYDAGYDAAQGQDAGGWDGGGADGGGWDGGGDFGGGDFGGGDFGSF
jgi:DNA uptake protein ComE-like DNA-binding protein